jgi:hypothetical protein
MAKPVRLDQQAGRWALVDSIPFKLPVYCRNSPALFAVFTIDADQGPQAHPRQRNPSRPPVEPRACWW